jgi:histidine triad (HIT) family protein
MAELTLFEKIIAREIPADIVYEDDSVIAFKDVNPQAPMHILVCPKKPIPMVASTDAEDADVLGHLLVKCGEIAADQGYADAFRLVINNGAAVGQSVFHLHVHMLGGRKFSWPPG